MRKLASLLTAAAVAAVVFSVDSQPVHAQKQYFDALVKKYPSVAEKATAQKCNVCHGKKKTERSVFATALATALGEKKVKDVDKINAALDTVAAMDSGNGTTYGDLLKAGTLPDPYKAPE